MLLKGAYYLFKLTFEKYSIPFDLKLGQLRPLDMFTAFVQDFVLLDGAVLKAIRSCNLHAKHRITRLKTLCHKVGQEVEENMHIFAAECEEQGVLREVHLEVLLVHLLLLVHC